VEIDFIESRSNVFSEVLQETALITCIKRSGGSEMVKINLTNATTSQFKSEHQFLGLFSLPANPEMPWLFPRHQSQVETLRKAVKFRHRLEDYGYTVSTGPLVWNRHKEQLKSSPGKNRLPLIWAESVGKDGEFCFKASRKNHQPYFEIRPGQEHLVQKSPCILLQRTSAKEQDRRLVAAILDEDFLARYPEGVVIENHLNVIQTDGIIGEVSLEALHLILNAKLFDDIFRCISGSVAVSAYELNMLPLPDYKAFVREENTPDFNQDLRFIDSNPLFEYHNGKLVT
jgi:adenine-specific DNA-methyltransferase